MVKPKKKKNHEISRAKFCLKYFKKHFNEITKTQCTVVLGPVSRKKSKVFFTKLFDEEYTIYFLMNIP